MSIKSRGVFSVREEDDSKLRLIVKDVSDVLFKSLKAGKKKVYFGGTYDERKFVFAYSQNAFFEVIAIARNNNSKIFTVKGIYNCCASVCADLLDIVVS